ncbi:V-type proton ATPase subunit H [Entamoeba marina]
MFHTPALQIPPLIALFNSTALEKAIASTDALSQDKQNILRMYIDQSPESRQSIVNEVDLKALIEVFYVLLLKYEHPAVQQNTTFLLDEFITADSNRLQLFVEMPITKTVKICNRLVRQLKSVEDNLTLLKSTVHVITVFCLKCGNYEEFVPFMTNYFQYVRGVYAPQTHTKTSFQPLHLINWSLFNLLNIASYRKVFTKELPLKFISEQHSNIVSTQDNDLLYGYFHVVWLLTFDNSIVEHEFPEVFIEIIAQVLLKIKVEKILRIVLLIINNLINVDWYVRLFVQYDYHRIIPVLQTRQFSDEDVLELLETVGEIVEKKLTETSSLQSYLDELKSGKMKWSPMHRSEVFWNENVTVFENENWALVRKLKAIINDKEASPVVVAVACFDLGEVARYHPLGRKIMNDLNIKMDLLQLSSSEQQDVKKNAMYALQKIMLHRWDMVTND